MLAYKPYTPAVRDCMPPLVYSLEESMQMNEINTVLEKFIDETRVAFITSGGIEAGVGGVPGRAGRHRIRKDPGDYTDGL